MSPKITVYITTYNYAKYLPKAIESVINQNFDDWELIIFNDGSTDNTKEIIKPYEKNHKITIVNQENIGLPQTNNKALKMAKGKYFVRLDGDDYFEENALLVMSNILDRRPETALVYPDYYLISENDEIIGMERRKKLGEEVNLLDLPAHGACTMVRKSVLEKMGGYRSDIECQDGYDLWIKVVNKYPVCNVNIPLFYYRQHKKSLTKDRQKILETRRKIKRDYVTKNISHKPKTLAIIPVAGFPPIHSPLGALYPIDEKPLVDYTIEEAKKCDCLDKIVLTTDNNDVIDYVKNKYEIEIIKRTPGLAQPHTFIEPTILFILDQLSKDKKYIPDIVVLLFITSPLRKAKHIQKAIDTLQIYNCDSVISIIQRDGTYYTHNINGLTPLIEKRMLKHEKHKLYEENGAVLLSKREVISKDDFLGKTVSHIEMTKEESIQLDDRLDLMIIESILRSKKE